MKSEMNIACRQARKSFGALYKNTVGTTLIDAKGRAVIEQHLEGCSRCALEYRLFALQRATLDAAAAPEPIAPEENFFRAVRARIARGPEVVPAKPADESWAAALFLTARQLIPAMAVLLLMMIGATLIWNQAPPEANQASVRPRERVVFPDMYDYPAPTRDDVLETLVALEEKQDGK